MWLANITAWVAFFWLRHGVVSGALLFLKNDFPNVSSVQKELVTSFLLAVAEVVRSARAGWPTRIGRRVAQRIGSQRTITATLFMAGVLTASARASPGAHAIMDGWATAH